jgi:hypothetical protein
MKCLGLDPKKKEKKGRKPGIWVATKNGGHSILLTLKADFRREEEYI